MENKAGWPGWWRAETCVRSFCHKKTERPKWFSNCSSREDSEVLYDKWEIKWKEDKFMVRKLSGFIWKCKIQINMKSVLNLNTEPIKTKVQWKTDKFSTSFAFLARQIGQESSCWQFTEEMKDQGEQVLAHCLSLIWFVGSWFVIQFIKFFGAKIVQDSIYLNPPQCPQPNEKGFEHLFGCI